MSGNQTGFLKKFYFVGLNRETPSAMCNITSFSSVLLIVNTMLCASSIQIRLLVPDSLIGCSTPAYSIYTSSFQSKAALFLPIARPSNRWGTPVSSFLSFPCFHYTASSAACEYSFSVLRCLALFIRAGILLSPTKTYQITRALSSSYSCRLILLSVKISRSNGSL